jgi:hypothetical protein
MSFSVWDIELAIKGYIFNIFANEWTALQIRIDFVLLVISPIPILANIKIGIIINFGSLTCLRKTSAINTKKDL